MASKKDKSPKTERSGGVVFYLSLCALLFLAIFNLSTLPSLVTKNTWWRPLLWIGGAVAGAVIARFFIRGKLSVFIHELKHSIISNLCGNRAKEMKIESESGSFEYEYSNRTAPSNAFIALAPYWVPLFTVAGFLAGLPFFYRQHEALIVVASFGWGIDMMLGLRDISPVQTDLTMIRGGYWIALLYVAAMNVTLLTLLMAWVLRDVNGLTRLFMQLWQFLLNFVTSRGLTL